MTDPQLVTKTNLSILRHIFFPGKKVLRQLSEKVQYRHLGSPVSAKAGHGYTAILMR